VRAKKKADSPALEVRYNLNGSHYYVNPNSKMPRGLKRFLIFLATLVGIYALLLVGVYFGQRRLIYFPNRATPAPAASVIDTATDITLTTEDGLQLGAWWVEPHVAVEPRNQVVLYAGGNAGNREQRSQLAFFLALRGFHVLSFDYRGYGGNPGTPTEAGLSLDARAALAQVQARGFDASNTIYFGESLGSAVVTRLAAEQAPAALVLRSPFPSLTAVGQWHFPWLPVDLLLRDRFPTAELLAEVEAPVLVLYGTNDNVVSALQSLQVAQVAPNLWLNVPFAAAGHNDSLWWGLSVAEWVESIGNAIR
jgi:fermentation-respiration switch protein FrsA (DUF1100 family)